MHQTKHANRFQKTATQFLKGLLLVFFAAGISFSFFGCRVNPDQKELKVFNNLEAVEGWRSDMQLIKMQAHSGIFATWSDTDQVYSLAYHLPLKGITNDQIYHVVAKVWAQCTRLSSRSFLVASLDSGGQHKVYKSVQVETFTDRTNVWFGVRLDLDLPDNARPEDELYVYVMNEGKDKVYFDDMEIEFITRK